MAIEEQHSKEDFGHLYIKGLNATIHLLTSGNTNGFPVIFLPGITSYSLSFKKILKLLPKEYYLLSMDIRGRGQSSKPKTGYSLDDYCEDLLNVLNGLAYNPYSPILVGHSMGARIATAFAAKYPSLISGAVLIDPPINGPGQRELYPNRLSMFLQQKEAVEENNMSLFASFFPSFSKEQLEERAEEYRNTSLQSIIHSHEAFLTEPFHMYLKIAGNAGVPMLLLAAEHGDTIRENEIQILKKLHKTLQATYIKDVGHMIYKERPELTAQYIQTFIEEQKNKIEVNNQ
jgi:N-formylmaleamate deformylase